MVVNIVVVGDRDGNPGLRCRRGSDRVSLVVDVVVSLTFSMGVLVG